ncbi:S-layer homology domain-containing protein [Dulcicalothrix desertica]|uniref:S-layer homology domain-containing protein n=1 Tax=Dulcicalothrix desertica TaxID=32056 RepID=UPI000F8E1B04|nr:S-layer homology domain-containing protein [Dulcicalothrix desertica]
MLYCKRLVVLLSSAVILSSLTACANSPTAKNLEKSLAADSRLQNNSNIFGANQSPQATPQPQPTVQLPADFPAEIPIYPNAQLQSVTPGAEGQFVGLWQSIDPSNFITSFYRSQFGANNWQIVQQPNDDTGTFEARRNNLLVRVTIQPKSVTSATPNQSQTLTELRIDYSPNGTAFASPIPSTDTTATPNPTTTPNTEVASNTNQPGSPDFIGPVLPNSNAAPAPTTTPTTAPATTTQTAQQFSDINKAPQQLQRYIQDLATLGVLTTSTNQVKENTNTNLFEPSKAITRREYARWLIAANNAMYASNPAKQIRTVSETAQPAFTDVPKTNPDFAYIQGLAEAGIIPSTLSGDSTEVLFRPDAPLTREQLLLWKLPLDTRSALPTANLEAVKQTWGFQDAGKIDSRALRAVLADYQNGEQSNIRRVFGFTTLFQPKRTVTRAEAAAALWYFGTQGDGISAADVLKGKT